MDKVLKWLSRYKEIMKKIKETKSYIDFCKERAESIPIANSDTVVVSKSKSTEAPFAVWVMSQVDAEAELKELREKANSIRYELEYTISQIKDFCLRMLLVYYYIDCLTWKQVGRKLNYSKATVMRKHTEAVEMVKKIKFG